jgi:hypothetical protein
MKYFLMWIRKKTTPPTPKKPPTQQTISTKKYPNIP